ncbi:uncharacterized protein LOC134830478 [Culicoides brevitarsis]|uniref:uncharacterized protein LOC134830478 n=1 Tax=Culicoides brevitarsis TaxID=469753 RepID=UPI00307BF82A
MGISASKCGQNDETDFRKGDDNTTHESPSISPFQRLKSLSNRYERFSANHSEKPQSLSMNNLEGELTPRKAPNSGLKNRLIKALGGYTNLLDPRSPSQIIVRTPLVLDKQMSDKDYMGLCKKNLVLETSISSNHENLDQEQSPYSIFEDNLDDQAVEKKGIVQETVTLNASENLVDVFDGLIINKDPRSPSDGIARTPLAFAVGTLQTPSLEMQQSFVQERSKVPNKLNNPEPKLEKPSTQLIKTIYKDLIRRDPIHTNLLNEDENEIDTSRTTPMKKTKDSGNNRTPLSCVANRTRNKPMQAKKLLEQAFEDNFSPKIDHVGDENTPIQMERKFGRKATNSLINKDNSMSKSKIPVGRSRRFH